jgi:hypothetical protein
MKRSPRLFLALGFMVVVALVAFAQTSQQTDPTKVLTTVKPINVASPCPGYDLAASITDITTGSDATGPYIRVTGKVKNIGGQDFTSTHTEARLFVRESDRAAGDRIKTVAITRLNKGQSVNIFGTYHLTAAPGFEWCAWGCVPLHGGICRYLLSEVIVNYGSESEKNADCKASNNISSDRPEHRIHFVVHCSE